MLYIAPKISYRYLPKTYSRKKSNIEESAHLIKADFNSGTECKHCTVEFM